MAEKIVPSAKKRKSRDGHARKSAKDKPATLEPAEEGPPDDKTDFDPNGIAEQLNLWRMNSKEATYFMPMKAPMEDWREIGERELRRVLKAEGVRQKCGEDERLSEAERVFEYVGNFRTVDFSGPLAGYKAGVHYSIEGAPFIVRGGPKLIDPKKGDASLIWEILRPRFEDAAGPQLDYFLMWLKRGFEPLREGRRRKGPMLILTGPNDCGKSFIQDHIITPLFGGRSFDPTDFFKNDAGFNKYMMASEHLAIGEFAFPLDGASRLMISEKFKKIVANDSHAYHPKGKDAMTMHPHFRLSISINDNPEKLRALPPMNNDLSDKVLLLRVCGGLAMPMPTNSDTEEAAFAAAVRAALPAFVHELLAWTPPEEMATGRFGMQVWQHPEIVDSLWEQEPGSRFAFLLDKELWPAADERGMWAPWGWGKAVGLHEQMTGDQSKHAKQFQSVAKHEGAFTQMLGLLFKRESEALARERRKKPHEIDAEDPGRRYAKRHTKNGNFWMIRPPA
jgi:hypothetical protein